MRKTIIFLIIILFLLSNSLPAFVEKIENIAKSPAKEIKVKISFLEPTIKNEGKYVTVEMENCSYFYLAGEPLVPYYNKILYFPLKTKIKNVIIEIFETKEIKLNKKIKPAPKPVPLDGKEHKIKIFEKEEIYESNKPYPEKWIEWHVGSGLHNDEHVAILSIHIFPIKYIPKENKITCIKNATVKIEYEAPEKPFVTGNDYDLLIICPSKFKSEMERLKAHKEKYGIRTIIETTKEIYLKYNGKDRAEKIKYAIKDCIENYGIKYVLLVGGLKAKKSLFGNVANKENWWVPPRYSHLDLDGYPEPKYLCDLYFADIYYNGTNEFCSWDTDNDGIFGEWTWRGGYEEKDERDLYPDVYVGRLPCRSLTEVKIMVDKIIKYESEDQAKKPWFKRFLALGGDSYDDTHISANNSTIEGKYANEIAYKWTCKRYNFTCIGLWPDEKNKERTSLTIEKFIEEQNKGSGFTFFSGHGDWGTWYNHPYYEDFIKWIWIRRLNLFKLNNKDMYPVVVIGGCHTAGFDKNLREGINYFTVECLSWVYARKINGGGIATIGNTALEYGIGGKDFINAYGGFLEARFFEVYGNGTDILGKTWGKEIKMYVSKFNAANDMLHCKAVENWILLGDPTLKIGGYEK